LSAHASHPRAAARDAVCDLLPSDTRSTKHVVSQHRAPTMRPPLRASRKSTRATQSQRRYPAKTRPCADAPATLDGSSASLRRPHRRHRSFTSTAEDSAATWKACQRRCALRSLLRRSRSSYRVPCIDACGVARPRASLLRNAVATATASPQTEPDASAQPITPRGKTSFTTRRAVRSSSRVVACWRAPLPSASRLHFAVVSGGEVNKDFASCCRRCG